MNRQKFETICEAVDAGKRKIVENTQYRYAGVVVGCQSDNLEVEAFGNRFDWRPEICRPADGTRNPLGPPSNR